MGARECSIRYPGLDSRAAAPALENQFVSQARPGWAKGARSAGDGGTLACCLISAIDRAYIRSGAHNIEHVIAGNDRLVWPGIAGIRTRGDHERGCARRGSVRAEDAIDRAVACDEVQVA